ncbi:hypothetical protein SCG7109_AC_00400 [Chlamydiales bacterium SCGC AG-110-M15]|nr:hypothetical protein SCG7109_AC_00400 [Chlamydiales bacterium SCGC AG-110-M15]
MGLIHLFLKALLPSGKRAFFTKIFYDVHTIYTAHKQRN